MTRLNATAIVSSVAIGLLAGTTSIALADGYGRAAPSAPAIYNWTGFYIGGSVGGAWENFDWRFVNPPLTTVHSFSATRDQGTFGGHVGAQIQFGSIVVGVEAGGIGNFDREFATRVAVSPTGPCNGIPGQICEGRMSDVFTIGPRLGLAWDKWLVYGTGGWATGTVETQVLSGTGTVSLDRTSHDQDGWFAGGGVEYALTQNLIFGVEYQHIDLGDDFHRSTADAGLPCPPIGYHCRDIGASEDIVRARLSYKFSGNEWRAAPAPLK